MFVGGLSLDVAASPQGRFHLPGKQNAQEPKLCPWPPRTTQQKVKRMSDPIKVPNPIRGKDVLRLDLSYELASFIARVKFSALICIRLSFEPPCLLKQWRLPPVSVPVYKVSPSAQSVWTVQTVPCQLYISPSPCLLDVILRLHRSLRGFGLRWSEGGFLPQLNKCQPQCFGWRCWARPSISSSAASPCLQCCWMGGCQISPRTRGRNWAVMIHHPKDRLRQNPSK